MSSDHKRAYIAVTEAGFTIAKMLKISLGGQILGTERHRDKIDQGFPSFSDAVDHAFKHYDELVFIMALGIVVRSTASYVKDKYSDPAIVVVDDLGLHAISFLSGHIGGANELTLKIAEVIGASPVITTATDIHGKGAFELYLRDRSIEPKPYREISKWANMNLAEGRHLWIIDENALIPLPKGCTAGTEAKLKDYPKGQVLYIGERDTPELRQKCKALIPIKTLVIGLGFRKGKTQTELQKAIEETLAAYQLNFSAIKTFATIGLKAKEEGLIALSKTHNIPITIIEESAIEAVQHLFKTSAFVEETVGVKNVSEPCAYLASGGTLLHEKRIVDGVTVAVGRME
jgi:cobalt-precorrin 5A hydrolase